MEISVLTVRDSEHNVMGSAGDNVPHHSEVSEGAHGTVTWGRQPGPEFPLRKGGEPGLNSRNDGISGKCLRTGRGRNPRKIRGQRRLRWPVIFQPFS